MVRYLKKKHHDEFPQAYRELAEKLKPTVDAIQKMNAKLKESKDRKSGSFKMLKKSQSQKSLKEFARTKVEARKKRRRARKQRNKTVASCRKKVRFFILCFIVFCMSTSLTCAVVPNSFRKPKVLTAPSTSTCFASTSWKDSESKQLVDAQICT